MVHVQDDVAAVRWWGGGGGGGEADRKGKNLRASGIFLLSSKTKNVLQSNVITSNLIHISRV